jgi:hypothetical protein
MCPTCELFQHAHALPSEQQGDKEDLRWDFLLLCSSLNFLLRLSTDRFRSGYRIKWTSATHSYAVEEIGRSPQEDQGSCPLLLSNRRSLLAWCRWNDYSSRAVSQGYVRDMPQHTSQTQIWLILNKMIKLKKWTWALLTKLQVYASLLGCLTRNYFCLIWHFLQPGQQTVFRNLFTPAV